MRQRMARLRALLDHDLSPAPIFAVFLGYWLPLEWMSSSGILAGATLLEKADAVASSAVFNFGLAALLVSLLVYLLGSVVFLFGGQFRKIIRKEIILATWLIVICVTILIIKRILFKETPVPNGIRWIAIFGAIAIAISFAVIGWSPRRVLGLPGLLGIIILPVSLALTVCEAAGVGIPAPVGGVVSASNYPDIILITLDALSARHLTMYGASRPTSPNLQAFSDHAVVVNQFYSNANWTRPGVASLLNGVRPWTHRADIGAPCKLVVDSRNLVRQLVSAGYDSECVSTNSWAIPVAQHILGLFGKTIFLDANPGNMSFLVNRFPSLIRGFAVGPALRYGNFVLRISRRSYLEKTEAPVAAAMTMLEKPVKQPRFLWLHLITPHDPYAPPEPYIGSFEASPLAREVRDTFAPYGFHSRATREFPRILEGRYDEAIRCMDDGLGRFFTWLKATGRYDRTLIVITADHGESFTHGYGGHGGPLLSEDLIHIPCLIKPPFHHRAERDNRLYEQCDLAPTILQMVGLPVPAGMEGYPISQKPQGLPVFAMNHDLQQGTRTFSVAIRLGDWKYVEHWGQWTAPWPQRELYDLASDPGENRNLVATRPDKAADLRGRILAELARRHIDPEKE